MNLNSNLSKLDLSNKDLSNIPIEVLNYKNLKKLNLSHNKISQIPKDIDKLKSILNLDFSNNNIKNIYSNTCNLKKINTLILNNNQIKTLPNQISKLKSLRKLSLSGNYLNSLPTELEKLINLTSLNISNNSFEEFPSVVLKLKNLKELWLNNNNFNVFPTQKILDSLTNLQKLYCFGTISGSNDDYKLLSSIKGNAIIELKKLSLKNISINKNIKTKTMEEKQIFVSYAHADSKWKEKVELFLKSMQFEGFNFDFWDDQRIISGEQWKEEIELALNKSQIAILLISTNYLASNFVNSNELPQILNNAQKNGTKVIPIIVSACRFLQHRELSKFQAVNDPNNPLKKLSEHEVDEILLKLTKDIEEYL